MRLARVSDVARFCGVSTKRISRWEAKGLLPEPKRDLDNWRMYDPDDVCLIYTLFWKKLPTGSQVASLLFDLGLRTEDEVRLQLLKLKAHGRMADEW